MYLQIILLLSKQYLRFSKYLIYENTNNLQCNNMTSHSHQKLPKSNSLIPQVYSKPCQTSKLELFGKIATDEKP